ncbi:protein FAM91A1 isoform X1 [Selaginella moellendorffii]|uniref:protein FAM91A1 isoform X1 n=2 Tax=Selaginella moellendorffii TaxID=88036 RepID=UPI000D1C2578|nr:protein FAM91A1 isoform X1 [Selaginella moellendorffii]|eukprot:XP_024528555.1 protein FAM91A1 isoform X1 [Selaginella moellendorffii]
MNRLTTNVEEQLIVKAIQEEVTWENLPKRLKLFMASKDDWHRKIKEYCIKKRLKWSECHARNACREGEYYDDLMRYLRKNLALFPYHLSENICRLMRVSPFRYYCDMLYEVMRNEKPYDSIPNFSAADALRLTGIGRNEFIDTMNKSRGKKFMWKMNKSIVKDMLPTVPVDIAIEPWWTVCVVNLSLEEYRKLSPEELYVIDKVCKEDIKLYCEFDPKVVRSLYRRGLVYFDILVLPDDRFQVSNLEGFVSNREQSYEDPIEEILYAVFVASSEHATISELAATLQVDLDQLEGAVSVACRLGWATKMLDPAALLNDSNQPGSPGSEGEGLSFFTSPGGQSPSHDGGGGDQPRSKSGIRVAFLIDANMTSYLMMGSFSPGLKNHAVTLYEAGKLGDSNIAEFCSDLKSLESTKLEGELQHFVDHALSLRYALECLRSGGTATDTDDELEEAGPGVVNGELENASDFESEFSFINGQGTTANRLSLSSDTGLAGIVRGKGKRYYRVDVLRCESLASLASATLQRLFQRDYSFVVSMIPLACPPLVASYNAAGPVHFGPPSRAAVTPWMKLLLYTVFECGPVSVVLLRGLRLRLLPPPLAGCSKALVWTWDGSTFAGIGGRLEGTMIPGAVLLHGLNSVLRHSAVLVQPFQEGPDSSPVTVDVPLPLSEDRFKSHLSGSDDETLQSYAESADELSLKTVGYIRFLRVGSLEDSVRWVPQAVEFGVPLSDTELCKAVCEGAVSCELFHLFSLPKHQDAMQQLKKMLHDFIGEYQANGPVAKLAYTAEKTETGRRPELTVNFSSRWNPFAEPDSPSPRKNPRSRRRHSSMMSFDGDILRAFSLAPIDHSPNEPSSASKSDPLDDLDVGDVPLPGVNLVFDGTSLLPLDIAPCLQGSLAPSLVARASAPTPSHR